MNVEGALLWGFIATVALTTITASGQGLGFTRMSFPFMLGTIFTADRRRAKSIGLAVHFINGLLFAFLYAAAFESFGWSSWWLGTLFGLVHAGFLLAAVMPVMPSMHPRMAHENTGPQAGRRLQPPGFLALHYGYTTPLVSLLAHLVYGAILGGCYRLAG